MPYDEFADDGDSGDESHGGGIAAIPGGLPPPPPPFPASATPATPAPLSEDDREFAELARQLIARLPAASASQLPLVCEVGPKASFSLPGRARLCAPENVERASRGPHRTPAAARPVRRWRARPPRGGATCSATSKAGLRSASRRARGARRALSLPPLPPSSARRARSSAASRARARAAARGRAAAVAERGRRGVEGLLPAARVPELALWRRRAE